MQILDQIKSYLGNGGLFNPEMMDPDAVRNLIMNARDKIESLETERAKWERSCHHWADRELEATGRLNVLRAAVAEYLGAASVGVPVDRVERARVSLEKAAAL